MKAILIT